MRLIVGDLVLKDGVEGVRGVRGVIGDDGRGDAMIQVTERDTKRLVMEVLNGHEQL